MEHNLGLLLFLGCLQTSDSDGLQLIGPAGPVIAEAGDDVVLPCHLHPNVSAVDMTVEWFRRHQEESLVHLYKDGSESNGEQIPSYRGRTALFKEELQKGNTSLKLSRARVSDEGEYKCLIQSEEWYDDIIVEVQVVAVGAHPVISVEGYSSNGGLNLLCETKGSNPVPEVLWLDSEGNILPAENAETHRDPEGFSVKKRVIVQDSDTNRFYCRVQLKDHMKEAEIVILSQHFLTWKISVIIWSLFSLAIAIGVLVFVCDVCRMKELRRTKTSNESRIQFLETQLKDKSRTNTLNESRIQFLETQLKDKSRTNTLNESDIQYLKTERHNEFKRAKLCHAVDVTLDPDTAHPGLILSEDGKQVHDGRTRQHLPDNPERFNKRYWVLGEEGFSSGRFYYEVQVRGKTGWAVGVAAESIERKRRIKWRPGNGCWTVGLWCGEYKSYANHHVSLSLSLEPQRVGVFVDYQWGLVSFYDAEDGSHIYSFSGQSFTEKLYPLLCPGTDDGTNSDPLVIIPIKLNK